MARRDRGRVYTCWLRKTPQKLSRAPPVSPLNCQHNEHHHSHHQQQHSVPLTLHSATSGSAPSSLSMLRAYSRCSTLVSSHRSDSSVPLCSTTPPTSSCTWLDTVGCVQRKRETQADNTAKRQMVGGGAQHGAPLVTPAVFVRRRTCCVEQHPVPQPVQAGSWRHVELLVGHKLIMHALGRQELHKRWRCCQRETQPGATILQGLHCLCPADE